MTFVSYAQNFEDVLLWRALGDVEGGFYIDIGASHPDTDSVTRAFYDRGWHGINVEPTAASFLRLTASRPRDVNLQMAVGNVRGSMRFHVVEGVDTGLSTLDDAAAQRFADLGMRSIETLVDVDTLAAICARYAPADIHFLKVDVEGAERAALEGADFATFRPWIVLVEATAPMSTQETHGEWEPILLEAGYRFVWFDGLNRFYVAHEHDQRLAPHFRTPPNVFDNFLRAADTEWTRRLAQAETRADALLARALAAESRIAIVQDRAETAHLRLLQAGAQGARALATAEQHRREADDVRYRLAAAEQDRITVHGRMAQAERERLSAEDWLGAMRRSTSWRVTGPLRRVLRALGRGPALTAPSVTPSPEAVSHSPPEMLGPPGPTAPGPLRAVHQFHSGTAIGDAITNAMLLTREVLRGLGYDSQIFAQHRAPGCMDEIRPIHALPRDHRYALIVRHSMGHDVLTQILALPVPKILLYHNITPPELLEDTPHMQAYAIKGRAQLAELRDGVVASLADSEYNALELRRFGFAKVAACAMLFDVERMLAAAPSPARNDIFTILFVGRLARSKGQRDLIEAFIRFRDIYAGQTRLVLVGRNEGDEYAHELIALIRRFKLDTGAVELAGLVSDAELHRRYAEADLYVSLSDHEGFGVPLIEAMAHLVPVLAWPSGAVPYTLAGASPLLDDKAPASVALQILALANDPAARRGIVERQRRSLDRWRLERHVPALVGALEIAGVQRPPSAEAALVYADTMQFTIAGHVNGTYSLSEVNRALAFALEAHGPGHVRLLPVEGDVTGDLARVPPEQRDAVLALATRPAPPTGPHVVISQHYPVWVPHDRGDLALAYFFWEESLVPAETVARLNAGFDGVIAPTRAVAKALIDSGVSIPVRVVGHAPSLARHRALRETRAQTCAGTHTFLHVSSGFPRKGIATLLAAYAAAFRSGDPVRLVLKTFPNPHNETAAQLDALRARDPATAEIELIDCDLDEAALLALYRDADTMVLPSRGEGFNLPAAEALAAGMSVIATAHGGHMDFLAGQDPAAVRLIDYRMMPAETHLSTPFSLWAEPNPADLAAALREASERTAVFGTPPAASDVADRIIQFSAELLQRAPRPALRAAFVTTWDVPCGIAGYSRHLADAMPVVTTILADHRTMPTETAVRRVVPSWTVGHGGDLDDLASALVREHPDAVVLQHQPGLLTWGALPKFLAMPAMQTRAVCVVLHNTQHLAEIGAAERDDAMRALRGVSRVVVHTVRDVNRLADLGLRDNVILIAQGVADLSDVAAPVVRTLDADSQALIGCYGFFLPDKGIMTLIEALPLIRAQLPNARLRLVNARYPAPISDVEIAAAHRLAAGLGCADAIEFVTEFLPEARSTELLAECDLIVLPYQQSKEASSAALRSAMAAQVPIAVTPLPLFDEAEEAVFRLPGTEPAALAEGVVRHLLDNDGRRRANDHTAQWRRQRHWADIGVRWEGLLRGLVGSGIVIQSRESP